MICNNQLILLIDFFILDKSLTFILRKYNVGFANLYKVSYFSSFKKSSGFFLYFLDFDLALNHFNENQIKTNGQPIAQTIVLNKFIW